MQLLRTKHKFLNLILILKVLLLLDFLSKFKSIILDLIFKTHIILGLLVLCAVCIYIANFQNNLLKFQDLQKYVLFYQVVIINEYKTNNQLSNFV